MYVNGSSTPFSTQTVQQGYVDVDVSSKLVSGSNKVEFRIVDAYSNKSNVIGTISVVSIKLESNFNYKLVYSDAVNFIYTPTGDVEKTVYIYVDGALNGTQSVRTSGEQQMYQLLNLSHGSHTIDAYFKCSINGIEVESNKLHYDIIYQVAGDSTPIIASQFQDLNQEQYITFDIPYRVYTPGKNTSDIELYVNGVKDKSLTVDQEEHQWEYRCDTAGDYIFTIKTGDQSRSFSIHVAQSAVVVNAVKESLALELSTYGRSNLEQADARSKWVDATHNISCVMTGFNYSSDGWMKDADGNTVLRVSGDARVEIPYKPFERDFKSYGKTIEIELATSAVRDYEAVIMSCFDKDRGFYITPQIAKLKSQQTELQTQYKENDHVRLTFVIEKNVESRIIYMYINGIASGAIQYPADDTFRQLTPKTITIGSNDAAVDIYNIRVYDNNLTRKQVVNNWIADTQSGVLKAERYRRNDNYNEEGALTVTKLPADLPYLITDINPLPQFKGDKRKGNVWYTDPLHPERSFVSHNAIHNVQGTSSAVYPVKNWKISYKKSTNGFEYVDSDFAKTDFFVTLGGIAANEFTYKSDYASSEGANNVELVKLYNDNSKTLFQTPPQKLNSSIRVGIDGFPIIAFQQLDDGSVNFITKMNFNNDKGNEAVYGLTTGDESWEVLNNNTEQVLFREPITDDNWKVSFEARYPDVGDAADITKLKEMTSWVVSTNRDAATGEALATPVTYTYAEAVIGEDGAYKAGSKVTKTFKNDTPEYRLAKFRAELENWFNLNSTIYYYLFTEIFLMVDSRAKNTFPTYFKSRVSGDGGDRWFWLPYDMDTALGINNEGALVFDYSLEDRDMISASTLSLSASSNSYSKDAASPSSITFAATVENITNPTFVFETTPAGVPLTISADGATATIAAADLAALTDKIVTVKVIETSTKLFDSRSVDIMSQDVAETSADASGSYSAAELSNPLETVLTTAAGMLVSSYDISSAISVYDIAKDSSGNETKTKSYAWIYSVTDYAGLLNEPALDQASGAVSFNSQNITGDAAFVEITAKNGDKTLVKHFVAMKRKEDNSVNGSYVFNAQLSTMWRNVRDAFPDKIADMYAELRKSGGLMNFDTIEGRFESHQSLWSEAIFNEDAYVKYVKPLISDGKNYLDMLQGSKTEQRRWWLYNRFRYLDSKFNTGDAKSDTVIMRAYATDDIRITPYADIYASVQYGNTSPVSVRAKRGVEYTLKNPLDRANDTEYTIFSASQLKSIGDLSKSKVGLLDVSSAVKLQELKVGDSASDYSNPNLTKLTLGKNTLLKKLDARNCVNLETPVSIQNCTNIEEAYFDNTKIKGVELPVGGVLRVLHLPDTITNLTIRNQPLLSELVLNNPSNIQTLWLENVPSNLIDTYAFISAMAPGSIVRLIGVDIKVKDSDEIKKLYDALDKMTGKTIFGESTPKAQVTGTLHVPSILWSDYVALSARYEEIKISADVIRCVINFYNESALFDSQIVALGASAVDPAEHHGGSNPSKDPTVKNYYTFVGWDKSYKSVAGDMSVNAVFETHVQVYTIKFDTRSSSIKISPEAEQVEYGALCKELTTADMTGIPESVDFVGWSSKSDAFVSFDFALPITPATIPADNAITLYANWKDNSKPAVTAITRTAFDAFEFTATDNVGIVCWQVVKDSTEPSGAWNPIDPVTSVTESFTIDAAGDWHIFVKDAFGNVNDSAYISAYKINVSKTAGVSSVSLLSDGRAVSTFALANSLIKIDAAIDDAHYEGMALKLNGTTIDDLDERRITGEFTYDASCSPKSFVVSFNACGRGSTPDSQTVVFDSLITEPAPQIELGYLIDGWYTSQAFDAASKWDFAKNGIQGDMTLYANWIEYHEPSTISITTDSANEEISLNISQTEANGTSVGWGDGSAEESTAGKDFVSFKHVYATAGDYKITVKVIAGSGATYNMGNSSEVQTVMPVTAITAVDFAWDQQFTNKYAFSGAVNLKRVTLTNYMTKISEGAFKGCVGLTGLPTADAWRNISLIEDYAFNGCTGITGTVDIPTNIKSINNRAFQNCSGITKVNLPEGLTSLGEYAFEKCTSLKEINFPSTLTRIPAGAFQGCVSFESVVIPKHISYVGTSAFSACTSLASVTLENKGMTIGQYCFNDCGLLTTAGPIGSGCNICFAWDTAIPNYAFSGGYPGSSLQTVTLPGTITSIGDFAFENSLISSIELPQALQSIGEQAFCRCLNLTSVSVPSSVSSIGNNAFIYCYGLASVKLYNTSSSNKIEAWENGWFRDCVKGILVIHARNIGSGTDLMTWAGTAYGSKWDYLGASDEATVQFDIPANE